mgnify:CR=1 FL=1
MYDIEFSLESMAEQGWYKDDGNKRKVFDYINLEDTRDAKEPELLGMNKQNL